MTNVSYPGVYIKEVPSGARPIGTASTSTAAFVGTARKGPIDRAVRVTSWQEFQRRFGGFISSGYLAEGVFQFFNNGGRQCYIVRVAGSNPVDASVTLPNRANVVTDGIVISASSPGSWGNSIFVKVDPGTNDSGNTFKLSVYEQSNASDLPGDDDIAAQTPVEVHDDLSVNPASPDYYADRLEQESDFIRARHHANNTAEVAGYHDGGQGPEVTIPADLKFSINVNGDGFQEITLPAAPDLQGIRAVIETAVRALTRNRSTTDQAAFGGFTCTIVTDPSDPTIQRLRLTSGTTGASSSIHIQPSAVDNATEVLKLGPTSGGLSVDGLAPQLPGPGDRHGVFLLGDHPGNAVSGDPIAVPGTDNAATIAVPTSYESAFRRLDKITDVSLLAAPGVPVFDSGVAYCENRPLRDLFFVGETGLTDDEPADAEAFRKGLTKPNTYGAAYFPWIRSPNLAEPGKGTTLYPPSGYMAGLFARIDSTRGVWKAPAGTEATISGATALLYELNDIEQGNLNRIGVNCLRRFNLAGLVSWGARTVHLDPQYMYVPVRRTAIMLRRSIYDGIQWAVFEPNDHRLWSALRLNIGAFMNGLFRAGAFQGQKASDAYFVRCGLGDTMTQGDIDRGMVIVEIGFAALKPAEFVVVSIEQKASQS